MANHCTVECNGMKRYLKAYSAKECAWENIHASMLGGIRILFEKSSWKIHPTRSTCWRVGWNFQSIT